MPQATQSRSTSKPPATYHLIWTTYGTWLPGDERGWIKKKEHGIQPADPRREQQARSRMAEPAIVLTREQRLIVAQTIRDHCRLRNWSLHAINVRTNHIHVVVTADRDPDEVVNQFKAWCSRRLSDAAGLTTRVAAKAGRRRWFTEGGDKEVINDVRYLHNAVEYVQNRQ
jgi:REP element-mobilizing transposase RayT